MIKSRKILVFLVAIVVLVAVLPGQISGNITFDSGVLFIAIGFWGVAGLLLSFNRASISLSIVHWLFVLIFFFVAPIAQASFGFMPWGISMENEELVRTNILVLIWCFLFSIGNRAGNKIMISRPKTIPRISEGWMVFLLILSCLFAVFLVRRIGIANVFTRAEMEASAQESRTSTAVSLILDKCTRAVIVFTEALLIMATSQKRRFMPVLVVNTVALLLSCFPLALARNSVGIIYLGLLTVCFYRNETALRQSPFFVVAFLIGIVVVFPIINVFRYYGIDSSNLLSQIKYTAIHLKESYLSGNYDAYAVITAVRKYVSNNGFSHGRQLLGVLAFFVPRSIWPSKPIGSGATVAVSRGMTFTNISCPLPAEGYINFGIIGLILFALLFGFVCTYIDRLFWDYSYGDSELSFIRMLYPFLPPSFFFVMRGDLMSSWAYTFAYIVVFFALFTVLRFKIDKKTR